MLRRYIIIIIFSFQGLMFSQEKNGSPVQENRLLYYFQEPGFLVPFIEDELKKMTKIRSENKLNDLYFNEVESFNRLKEDVNLQSEMANIVWNQYNAKSLINLELIDNEIDKEIINTILSYNYFLTIKTNTLGELIEFQFELFETEPLIDDDSKGNVRKGVMKNVKKVENFFINPSNKDYLNNIKNALYRLFDENNDPPTAIVRIYDKLYSEDFELSLSIGDTINISGAKSYDFDTEELIYHWKNVPDKNQYFQHINKVDLSPKEADQSFEIGNDSIYSLNFYVDDGINVSKPINIKLNPVEKPKPISPLYKESKSYDYITLKSVLSNVNNKGFVSIDITDFSNTDKLLISKKELGQKFLKNKHKNDTLDYTFSDSLSTRNITFKSDFVEKKDGLLKNKQSKKYYLYKINKEELLSKPIEFEHKYVKRGSFMLRSGISFTSFGKDGEFGSVTSNDSIPLGSTSVLLELSIDISNKFRVSSFLDKNTSNDIEFKGYVFAPQPELGISTMYYFLDRYSQRQLINPFVGIELGCTSFISEDELLDENRNPEEPLNFIYTYGMRAGLEYNIETRWFLFSPGFQIKYGQYNKSFLKDNYYYNMGLVLNFKI